MSFTKSTKFFIMGLLGAFLVGGVGAIGRLWEKHNKKIIPVILYCTLTPNGEGIAYRYYYENDTVEERENAIAMATSLIAH